MAQEKNFENKIKKFLKEQGAWHIKYWAGAPFTKAGIPDILACIGGYFVGIEVKAPEGVVSEIQKYNIKQIRQAKGFAFALYPSGYDQFQKFIEDLKQEKFNRDMPEILK